MSRRAAGAVTATPLAAGAGVDGAAVSAGPPPRVEARLRSPLPTRQRRPALVAVAVALIVGLGAVGAYLYTQAGAKTPVVMVVNEVAAGQPIERADLTTVAVAGPVTAIAGGNVESVVGQRAAIDLLPDMLLQRAMVTDADPLGPSEALVGVLTRPGQIPAGSLAPGDVVSVLRLPAANAAAPAGGGASGAGQATVLVERAEVFAARTDPSVPGGTVLSLVVDREVAPAVAAASGAGLVALVQVADR